MLNQHDLDSYVPVDGYGKIKGFHFTDICQGFVSGLISKDHRKKPPIKTNKKHLNLAHFFIKIHRDPGDQIISGS